MQLDTKQSDDSYSVAAKERMAIELDGLVWRLNEVGSALATLNIFRSGDIEIEGHWYTVSLFIVQYCHNMGDCYAAGYETVRRLLFDGRKREDGY